MPNDVAAMIHRLPPSEVGMIVDRGNDFPPHVQQELDRYGKNMWLFRDHLERETTRAANIYHDDCRGYVFANHSMHPSRLNVWKFRIFNDKIAYLSE